MLKPAAAIAGQVVLYGAFAAFIGYFATDPKFSQIPDDVAVIKVSFSHLGDRECRKRTPEELAKLPPNMRAPMKCPRERSPVTVEVDLDGTPAVRAVAPPTGLSRDGASAYYQRLAVPAGERRVAVRLRDDARSERFAYEVESTVKLAPAQVLVIDFDAGKGGITFQ